MNILFRCEYKLTKKHINEARMHTLMRYMHFDYVAYAVLVCVSAGLIIRSIQTQTFIALICLSFAFYYLLIRNFIRFRNLAHSIPQKEVFAGEKYVKQEVITVSDDYITLFSDENISEKIELSSVKQLGITVDTFILYIIGRKYIVIPQYSFIGGNKNDFVEFMKNKGIKISGKLHN